ncbi:MAG: anti-sigma factor family protein [Candidatus Promineifilaceae bacterium]
MFDFLRNIGQPTTEKQQELLSAYIDGELSPDETARLEQMLAQDSELQRDLRDMRLWQQEMRALPSRRVPRNFTLDPALYGSPQRQPLAGAYPLLRGATALAAFLLAIALVASMLVGQPSGATSSAEAPMAMMQIAEDESAPLEAPVEEMTSETAAESIILEEAVEKEADQAVPEAAEEAALLPQRTREVLPGLEVLDATAESSLAEENSAAGASEDTAADSAAAAEARSVLETPAPPLEEPAPAAQPSAMFFTGTNVLLIVLGALFVLLFALTLAARGQR